jgi:siroheme synthase-like protein
MGHPIVLDLRGRTVVVVGGGTVATRKIARLLHEGAQITVISPAVTESIQLWAEQGRLQIVPRSFESADVAGAELLFAATNSADANARVVAEARAQGKWVNVADDSVPGDFTVPAVARFGLVQLAVDTGGGGPALARVLRMYLQETMASGWGRAASIFQALRPLVRPIGNEDRRRTFWRTLAADLPEVADGTLEDLVSWVERGLRQSELPLDKERTREALQRAVEEYEELRQQETG